MATVAIFFPVASAFQDGLARTDPGNSSISPALPGAALAGGHRSAHSRALPDLVTGPAAGGGLCAGRRAHRRVGRCLVRPRLRHAVRQWRSQTAVVFAALFLVAAMSVILRGLVDLVTANLTPWAPESGSRAT